MARRVFFSFYYKEDIWRASQVRNSWVTQGDANPFLDAADWEEVKKKGDRNIKKWIDEQMHGTSVTAVLIGKHTAERKYVQYELEQSYKLGKGILGVYIHGLKNQDGETYILAGANPLAQVNTTEKDWFGSTIDLASKFKTYNWTWDDGYKNFSSWVEEALAIAKKK